MEINGVKRKIKRSSHVRSVLSLYRAAFAASVLLVDTLLADNLTLLLNEVTTRLEEVARLQYHSLGLRDDAEEQHSCT